MSISKKFMEVLQLSFEAKYLGEDIKLSKKKNKIKAVEDRMNSLYNYVIDVSTDPKFDDIVALAAAHYNIGKIYASSSDINDINTAIITFSRCLELLKGKQLDPKAILTCLGALNELNLVCDKMQNKKYTFKFLNTAMELYLKYTMDEDFPDPVHIATIANIKEEESNPRMLLDNFHYRTLQDLGIQYFAEPRDKHGFVMYIHKILNIRLSEMLLGGIQFHERCLDWALTLFDLSKYFLANNRFVEARNHIATADYVIHRFYEDRLKPIDEESNSELLYDSYEFVCSVSARTWGIYGVLLLRFWLEKFSLHKGETDPCELDISNLKITSEDESKMIIFFDLEKELESMTNQIMHTRILNLTEAKSLFVQTLRHLDTAKEYYSADTDIESYAKIILDISDTYKYLAGFEQQRDKQIKLHKRRVECLENVCNKFSTTIDVDSELQIYKRVCYEMVTSCSTVMDLMIEEAFNNNSFHETTTEAHRYAKLISKNINLYLDA